MAKILQISLYYAKISFLFAAKLLYPLISPPYSFTHSLLLYVEKPEIGSNEFAIS